MIIILLLILPCRKLTVCSLAYSLLKKSLTIADKSVQVDRQLLIPISYGDARWSLNLTFFPTTGRENVSNGTKKCVDCKFAIFVDFYVSAFSVATSTVNDKWDTKSASSNMYTTTCRGTSADQLGFQAAFRPLSTDIMARWYFALPVDHSPNDVKKMRRWCRPTGMNCAWQSWNTSSRITRYVSSSLTSISSSLIFRPIPSSLISLMTPRSSLQP